jgi:hypothetical protein
MSLSTLAILSPVSADIDRVERVLALLGDERDPIVRADLAEELVNEEALLEDSKDQALYPFLSEVGFDEIAEDLRRSSLLLRGAMSPVFFAVHDSVPLDAHFNDEDLALDIERLCDRVQTHMALEVTDLSFVSTYLTFEEKERIRKRLRNARRRAVDRPRHTHNPLRRLMTRIASRIDRRLPDTSAQYRPGREKLEP